VETEYLSSDEIVALQKKAYRSFYLRPKYLLRMMKRFNVRLLRGGLSLLGYIFSKQESP